MADSLKATSERVTTTTADVLETIERAAKSKSKQPQYAANAESFYGAVMRWVKSAQALEQPDYATDSRRRDAWMLDFWRLEPHLAGVLNSVLTINSNRGWTLTGGRNQVYRYTSVLHDQTWAGPSLNGWRPYFTVQSLSYYATDMGVISEVGRQGRRGPLRALYHTDPSRCKLTGNTKAPLAYYPRSGKRQLWTPDDYFRICSMPAAQEKYLNLGFSAVSRCIELAKMMIGILEHDQEMIGARMPKGLLLLQGISEAQWEEALKAREAKQDSLERLYFGGVMTLATAGLEQLDARLVALSQLPAGFDKKEFMDLLMYGYALCFGYDPSEFWPVQYGAMGRGTEVETQHRKATGKGGLEFVLAYQENLQRLLPDTLQFEFEQRDEEGQLLAAQVAQAWADVAKTLYEAGQTGAGPLLMREQALSLLVEVGTIPPEWSQIQEEEKISDVEVLERDSLQRARSKALSSPTVQRAAALFPSQPIIRYHYPSGRVDVLWNSGADALTPSVWRGWRQAEDESEVLWRDPDGEFTITEQDVDRAIETARRRVGPEFAALLEAKVETDEEEAEEEETERDALGDLIEFSTAMLMPGTPEGFRKAIQTGFETEEAKVKTDEEEETEHSSLADNIAQGLLVELHKQLSKARKKVGRGGPGSGHHGHAGRPGEVGGSAPDGGGDETKGDYADRYLAVKDDPQAIEDLSREYMLETGLSNAEIDEIYSDADEWVRTFKMGQHPFQQDVKEGNLRAQAIHGWNQTVLNAEDIKHLSLSRGIGSVQAQQMIDNRQGAYTWIGVRRISSWTNASSVAREHAAGGGAVVKGAFPVSSSFMSYKAFPTVFGTGYEGEYLIVAGKQEGYLRWLRLKGTTITEE